MVFPVRPKNCVLSQGIQLVQLRSFLDGTLKLRYCTTSFSSRFPSCSLPWNGVTTSHLLDDSGNVVKRVGLTRKTRPGTLVLRFLTAAALAARR